MRPKFAEAWWDEVPVSQLRQEVQRIYRVLTDFVTSKALIAESDEEVHLVGTDDIGYTITVNSDNATTIALPSGVLGSGHQFEVARLGTGAVTIQGGSSVTINGTEEGSVSLSNQWGRAKVLCLGNDQFLVTGDVT